MASTLKRIHQWWLRLLCRVHGHRYYRIEPSGNGLASLIEETRCQRCGKTLSYSGVLGMERSTYTWWRTK